MKSIAKLAIIFLFAISILSIAATVLGIIFLNQHSTEHFNIVAAIVFIVSVICGSASTATFSLYIRYRDER